MGIHVLPSDVAAQIAAGEVVERPASVVKELLENSIDAGAGDIYVEIQGSGKKRISVIDDGCGVPAADVELAFHRHATSKLSAAADLDCITTLGFRGEALASIAAVSRVTFVTRSKEETAGTLLRMEGGKVIVRQPTGRPPGTTITVDELFYNVPARRKFLRSDATERRHIDAWVTRYSIAYPRVRFTLVHDERETFQVPGRGDLREVLVAALGTKAGAALLEIPEDPGGDVRIGVRGFVAPPSLHRPNRRDITLFVNGRWVQDSRLTYAVIQAYHTLLPAGRYPVAVVMISVPPQEVDVNIHPAKAEVRFEDENVVFRAVQRAVRHTVLGQAPVAPAGIAPSQRWPDFTSRSRYAPKPEGGSQSLAAQPSLAATDAPATLPVLRPIGQVGATYIVAEGPSGLYLIDQHAAHERVLYEQMMARKGRGGTAQALLEPTTVDLSPEAAGLVEAHLETLQRLGFQLELFGANTFLVRALPAVLTPAQPSEVLADIAKAIEEGGEGLEEEAERLIVGRVCKRAAVKAGQVLTREEMEGLVQALEGCANPRTCPHGRPTMIHLSVDQLAHQFGRA